MELKVRIPFCLKGMSTRKKKINNCFLFSVWSSLRKLTYKQDISTICWDKALKISLLSKCWELSFWNKTTFIENRETLFWRSTDNTDVKPSMLSKYTLSQGKASYRPNTFHLKNGVCLLLKPFLGSRVNRVWTLEVSRTMLSNHG